MSFSDYIKLETDNFNNVLKEIDSKIEQSKNTDQSSKLNKVRANINSQLSEATQQLNHTIKLIKRNAKSENGVKELHELNEVIRECSDKYSEIIEKLQEFNHQTGIEVKISKSAQKQISQTMLQSSETLRELNETSKLISKKVTIVEQRRNLRSEKEKELDHATVLPRFDLFIDQMKEGTETKKRYDLLRNIVTNVKLKNEELEEDIIRELATNFDDNNIVKNYLNALLKEIDQTKNRKINLIRELNHELMKVSKYGFDDPRRTDIELKCFIIYQQIQNNPFDLPLKIELKKNDGSVYFLKTLVEEWTSNLPHDAKTLEFKNEGLKRIQAKYQQDFPNHRNEEILISGAGPSGLLYALTYALQDREFTLIEVRGEDDPKRKNIVILGKEDLAQQLKMLEVFQSVGTYSSADVKLLEFFGITDQLYVNNQITPFGAENPGVFQVSLENLQNAMIERLSELVSEEKKQEGLIRYRTRISEIIPQDNSERATITYKTIKKDSRGTETSIQPRVVHVCEGYRTTTRDLLGIDVQKQSTAEPVVLSYFSRDEQTGVIKQLDDAVKIAKIIPTLTTQVLTFKLKNLHNEEIERNYFQAIGKFELLLTSPAYDYFYTTLTGEQKKEHEKIKNHIRNVENQWANEIIHFLKKTNADQELIDQFSETNRKNWLQDDVKRERMFKQLEDIAQGTPKETFHLDVQKSVQSFEKTLALLNKDLDKLYKQLTQAQTRHKIYNHFLFNQNISLRDYQESIFAESQIINAEASDVQIGKTRFSLDGDTKTASDPTTGSGLRTSALRTTFAPEFYSNLELEEHPLTLSATNWAIELSARSMREEGFFMRDIYATGSERIERFLDIAKESQALSDQECQNLLRLRNEVKAAKTAKIPIHVDLSELRDKLRTEYLNRKHFLTDISEPEIDLRLKKTTTNDTLQSIVDQFQARVENTTLDDMNKFLNTLHIRNITPEEFFKIDKNIKENKGDITQLKNELENILFPLEFPSSPKLNKKEEKIFVKVWKAALLNQDINLTQKEMNVFKRACGKMALVQKDTVDKKQKLFNYKYKPEVWFTYLYVYSKNLETRTLL